MGACSWFGNKEDKFQTQPPPKMSFRLKLSTVPGLSRRRRRDGFRLEGEDGF